MDKRRLLLIVLCSFAAAFSLRMLSLRLDQNRDLTPEMVKAGGHIPALERALRPNYPYSVIPGGAYSAAELVNSVNRDSIVRNHYADFNLKAVRLVTLQEDRYQYVSYRLHNQVFWTRNQLRIPKGEVLLTDGCNYARTRCGNRLSNKRHSNIAAEQPSEKVLSLPPFTPKQFSKGEVTLAPAPPIGELAQEFPEMLFDLPHLQPFLERPVATPPVATQTAQVWPPFGVPAPPTAIFPGYLPTPAAGVPPVVVPPVTPIITPPPPVPVSPAPEPASLTFFTITLLISSWALTRMMYQCRLKKD